MVSRRTGGYDVHWFHLGELSIPDSELALKATKLVAEISPQFLYHHCMRTFLFANLIGQRQEMKIDRELLYLGAIMHDLGLTERFDGDQRYEVDGADAAREFLLQHGLPKDRAEVVWDAIALVIREIGLSRACWLLLRHPAKCRVSRCSGVHVYSQCYKVAALGNITVHPNFRGQGLGTILCARLCQHYYPQLRLLV